MILFYVILLVQIKFSSLFKYKGTIV